MPVETPNSIFIPVASPLRPLTENELRQRTESRAGLPIRTPEERAQASRDRVEARANVFVEAVNAMQAAGGVAQEAQRIGQKLATGEVSREQAGMVALQTAEAVGTFVAELPIETFIGGRLDFWQDLLTATADLTAYVQDMRVSLGEAVAGELGVLGEQNVLGRQGETVAESLSNARLEVRPLPAAIEEPTTGGGRLVRDLVSFVRAMGPAMRAVRTLGLGRAAASSGRLVQGTASIAEGAAAFGLASGIVVEPAQERLSNLLIQHPALQNPVLEWLAHDEDEERFEGRIKNALEGAAIGVPFETLMIPLRFFKRSLRPSSAQSQALLSEELAAPRAAVGEFEQAARRGQAVLAEGGERRAVAGERRVAQLPFGEDGAVAERRIAARRQQELGPPARREVAGAARPLLPPRPASAVGESLQNTVQVMRSIDEQSGDQLLAAAEAARGATTEVAALQQASKISTKSLFKIRPGDTNITLAQERALQMRREILEDLLTQGGERISILEIAGKKPSKALLGQIVQFKNLYEAFTIRHQPIVSESGRIMKFQQRRALPKGFTVNLEALGGQLSDAEADVLIAGAGGRDAVREIASRTALLAGPDEIHAWWSALSKQKKADEFTRHVWYSGLLSGTALIKAFIGNPTYATQLAFERNLAAQLPTSSLSLAPGRRVVTSALSGTNIPDFIAQGEGATMAIAMLDSIGGAIRVGKRALVEESFEVMAQRGRFGGTFVDPFALSAEASRRAGQPIRAGIFSAVGRITQLPFKGLIFLDDVTQAVVSGADVRAIALREATVRGLEGKEAETFIADFLINTPDDVLRGAVRSGQEAGLRQPPAFLQDTIREANKNIVFAFTTPFLKPGVARTTLLAERTPLALFAPSIRAALARGGADSQDALSKIIFGTSFILAGFDLAMKGKITGRWLRQIGAGRTGNEFPPDSSYIDKDNQWRSYGPDTLAGFALTVGADIYAHSQIMFDETGTLTDKGAAVFAAAARIGMDEIALDEITRALGVIYEGGTDINRGREALRIGERIGATFAIPQVVPVVQGIRAQFNDEKEMRELNGLWDRVLDRTGIAADFPRRDVITGKPLDRPNPLYNAIPFAFTKPNEFGDVEKELVSLSYINGRFPIRRMRRTFLGGSGKAIELNDRQYDRLQEIAGVELDRRNAIAEVMGSDVYATVPPDQKVVQIQTRVTEINEAARELLLAEEAEAGDPDGLLDAMLDEELRRVGEGTIPVLP